MFTPTHVDIRKWTESNATELLTFGYTWLITDGYVLGLRVLENLKSVWFIMLKFGL